MLKKRTLTLIFLYSFLLITIFPVVIAVENPDSLSRINGSQIQVPPLHFNSIGEKVIVNNELSVKQISAIPYVDYFSFSQYQPDISIPTGAIIYHDANETTVFDASGNQLFLADDNQAAIIRTIKGNLPATFIHEVPSNSTIVNLGDALHIINNNTRILTIIRNTSSSGQQSISQETDSSTPTACVNPNGYFHGVSQYIEGADTWPTSISSPYEFSTDWIVPASPTGYSGSCNLLTDNM
jgi:hypothetical protein